MSEYTTYGGFGDGGGFNADSNSGFSAEGGSSQKAALRTSLTPVTLKQISEATQPVPDGDFQVGGVELNMVSFVGVLRSLNTGGGSNFTLAFEDGSGGIEIRKWIDENTTTIDQEQEKYTPWLNKYVSVTGSLKDFNGKKTVQNSTIRLITDHNEVLYHNLSAIYLHLRSQGLESKPAASLFVGDDEPKSTGSASDRVEHFIKANSRNMSDGVPIQFISQSLGLPQDVVATHCQALAEAGKVYSGYEDSTYMYL